VRLLTLVDAVAKHTKTAVSEAPPKIVVRADARLRAVIPGYLKNRRGDVDAIRDALARSDYEAIRELGHKMNGSGSGYGFPRITEIGQGLENASRERNGEAIQSGVAELSAFLDQVEVV
jgi:HPt (histidine-containing phosphotransfer) domain-containing protein